MLIVTLIGQLLSHIIFFIGKRGRVEFAEAQPREWLPKTLPDGFLKFLFMISLLLTGKCGFCLFVSFDT